MLLVCICMYVGMLVNVCVEMFLLTRDNTHTPNEAYKCFNHVLANNDDSISCTYVLL